MPPPQATLTDDDHRRLTQMLSEWPDARDNPSAQALRRTLDRATVMPSRDIPYHIITMQSRFLMRDPETGGGTPSTLVYPHEADGRQGRLSVLSPAGVAVLGRSENDVVEWTAPTTSRHARIGAVSFQPEASDAFWAKASPLVWDALVWDALVWEE